jgi:hypothetical protein
MSEQRKINIIKNREHEKSNVGCKERWGRKRMWKKKKNKHLIIFV